MGKKNHHSLALQQAKSVFVVSILIGLCFSSYWVVRDLHTELQRVAELYTTKLAQFYIPARHAIFHADAPQASQIVQSLMVDPLAISAELNDAEGQSLAFDYRPYSETSDLYATISDWMFSEVSHYAILLHHPDHQQVIGQMNLTLCPIAIAEKFVGQNLQLLLFDLIRTALLTAILLVFFYFKISKPIVMLDQWVKGLKEQKLPMPLPLRERHDELGSLALSFDAQWRARHSAENRLNTLAYFDPLTGLANRSRLLRLLEDALQRQSPHSGVLFYLDLDRFKTINDSLGHPVGDELMRAMAHRLQRWKHEQDTCARVGGDEFAILMPTVSPCAAHAQANQLLKLLSQPYSIDGHQLYASVSIGIASLFEASPKLNIDVLRQADTALNRAKVMGKNCYVVYETNMQTQVEAFLETEKGLHQAIAEQQLVLYYQHQVDQHCETIGMETLIRWQHPKRGLLSPDEFMTIAEETGQIHTIGQWILEQACQQMARWIEMAILPPTFQRLAINISPAQFSHPEFVDRFRHALHKAELDGRWIELEITENLLLENMQGAAKKMAQLKQLGASIALDDFGTGYSSLRYLKHLDLDVLKIDRSFVTGLHRNDSDQAIVDSIIMTAKRLHLEVIAEGVEESLEMEMLAQMGCRRFQGYLFDTPHSAEDISQQLLHQNGVIPPLASQW